MYRRVEQHFDALRQAVHGAGGDVFATMGDGIAAAFPSAEAALHAAIAAQREMPPRWPGASTCADDDVRLVAERGLAVYHDVGEIPAAA